MSISATSATGNYPLRLFPEGIQEKTTREKKIAEKVLPHTHKSSSTTTKFVHPLSVKNILKKTIVSKVREIPQLTAKAMHFIYTKVQKSLSALFVIKKLDARINIEENLIETLKKNESSNEATIIKMSRGIAFLHQQRRKWVSRLLDLRKFPPGFFGIISACLTAIYTLGSFTKSMSSKILVGLRASTTWTGSISGGLSILFGGLEIFLGIKKLRAASKQLNEITLSIDKLEEEKKKPVPYQLLGLWKECFDLQQKNLYVQELQALKHWRRSVFQLIAGSFAIVGGALGIASIFTGGWASVGISIAAGVAGVAGIAVSICSFLRTRPLKKRIEAIRIFTHQDLENLIPKIQKCSPTDKEQLLSLLDINSEKFDKAPLDILKLHFSSILSKNESKNNP